jgi:outer membrane immunogenic protein
VIRRHKSLWAFVCALAVVMACCVQPVSAQSIGSAAVIKNDVQGVRGSATRVLATGGSVFSDDQVKTGADSLAQLVFLDQTNLTVAANSQAVLREVYRPKQGYSQLVMKTVAGSFRYVSGVQSSHRDVVEFPQGYLTVRGTTVDIVAGRTRTLIILIEGAITVVPFATRIPHDLSIPGTSLIVYNDGHVDGPMTREAALEKLHLRSNQFATTIWPTQTTTTVASGFYVASGGGVNLKTISFRGLQDLDADGPFPIQVEKLAGLQAGWLALIAEGFDFNNGWRVELEESYRHNSGAQFYVTADGPTTVGVDRASFAVLANIWRDFALANGFAIHIGGGVGVADLNTRINNTFGDGTSFHSTRGAYQAGVGLDFAASPNLKLFLDYRIFGFFNGSNNVTLPTLCGSSAEVITCGGAGERVVLSVSDRQVDQAIIFGARFAFGPYDQCDGGASGCPSLFMAAPQNTADMAVKMPVKAPPPPPAPVYSWTGWYLGGNVGYSWGKARTDTTGSATSTSTTPFLINPVAFANSQTQPLVGVIGGGQVGYNYQVSQQWVVGFEADIQGSAEHGSSNFIDPFLETISGASFDLSGSVVSSYEAKIDWFGTARGRVGMLTNGNGLLLYGTGGLAYGRVSFSGDANITASSVGGGGVTRFESTTTSLSESKTNIGFAAGGGMEGRIAPTNWTWKLEYLYVDLGSVDAATSFAVSTFTGTATTHTHFTDNIIRAGLNYQFH